VRKLLLRLLGNPERSPRQAPQSISPEEVVGLRTDVRDLVIATDSLAIKLDETVTRDEVAEELELRLARLELGHASILSGAKNQIRRTRKAAWIIWVFLLIIFGILVIQVHDLHIAMCMLRPVTTPTSAFVCDAAFPLHNRITFGDMMPGMAEQQTFTYAVSPQLVGGAFYLALLGGLTWGIVRYRRSSSDEDQIEAGDIPTDTLEQMAAATEHVAPQSREDAEDGRTRE